ncbi:MAG: ornithine carbamoyltransferase [Actinobacteria bacterium]|nr:MAG: ornithine carbamoyltransferase [Actinomycetota bacterium]
MKNILTLEELNKDELFELLAKAISLKKEPHSEEGSLYGKSVALIFKKSSTRTRVSFEAGVYELGGNPIYLHATDLQLGRGETTKDTAHVLSRYVSAIVVRTYAHSDLEEMASVAEVPVINALTDDHHPCQALADMMTILEKKDRLQGIKIAYVGDGNNVCHSLIIASALAGADISIATPIGYEPNKEIVKTAMKLKSDDSKTFITDDPLKAVSDADVIYTDVWASMGQEEEHQKRIKIFKPYQVNKELISKAKDDALIMHCLPAHRGEEITSEIIDSTQSVVWDQAENRLHTQKALLWTLLGERQ